MGWNIVYSGPQYGLQWDGSGTVVRRLQWVSPPAIYGTGGAGMTYVFKVRPSEKIGADADHQYWTTFFWGNNGTFFWNGGNAGTYYGMHPYPFNKHDVSYPTSWEISVYAGDFGMHTSDTNVVGPPPLAITYDRWYTHVIRVWRESSTTTHHEFYYDWPDTTKCITKTIVDAAWAATDPPSPAIVVGQAPDNGSGASWGGYVGYEEFKGVIRGIQIYDALLNTTDVANEIASPKSTVAGAAGIWYLNVNPRPSDVTDQSGAGHHPAWATADKAAEWVG